MLGDSIMGKGLVKEHTLGLMEVSMLGNSGMGIGMVKEHLLHQMEISMKENGRMDYQMGKGCSLLEKGNGKETSI